MGERNFIELLNARQEEGKDICVGLDSDDGVDGGPSKIPEAVKTDSVTGTLNAFNQAIISANL